MEKEARKSFLCIISGINDSRFAELLSTTLMAHIASDPGDCTCRVFLLSQHFYVYYSCMFAYLSNE